MYLTWNNVPLPNFIKITDITKTALPALDHTLLKVVGRTGYQYAGTVLGAQKIDVSFIFVEQPTIKIDDMPRYFCEYFGVDAGQLRITGMEGFYYNALLDPPPSISGIAVAGTGDMSFNLYEGFAWSDSAKTTGDVGIGSVAVSNTGDLPSRAIIKIKPSSTISGLKITNQTTGEFIIADTNNIPAGSTIICDMYREELYIEGGASLMQYISLTSNFFDLKKGNNSIELSNPYGAITGTWEVTHQTRMI